MNKIDYKTAYESVIIANKMLVKENKQLKERIKEVEDYASKVGDRRNELYDIIDKAIEYFKYQLDNLDFYKDTKAKMLCAMGITLLQEGDKE